MRRMKQPGRALDMLNGMTEKELMGEFRSLLDDATQELSLFLVEHLPGLGENWWESRVLARLTDSQRDYVIQHEDCVLSALDLAQLLRVFDQNWYDLKRNAKLQNRARNFLKEMQTIRNEWAHMNLKGVKEERLRRESNTLRLFLETINANEKLLNKVKGLEKRMWSAGAQCDSTASRPAKPMSGAVGTTSHNGGRFEGLELGCCYTREQIKEVVGGGNPQIFLPNKGGRILAACIDPAKNPDAPDVILAGRGQEVERAAALLSTQGEPIPIFVKEVTNRWCYRGMFSVSKVIEGRGEIDSYAEKAGRQGDVSRVIIMGKV